MLTPLSSAFQRTLVPALTPSEQKDGSEAKSQYTEVALVHGCVGKLRKNC